MTSEYNDAIWELVPERGRVPDPWLARRAGDFVRDARSVLDLGCGDGLYLPALAARGANVWGVDRSAVALERASRAHPGAQLRQVGPDERIPLDDNAVERVWCCDTLEHVVDTQTVLSEVRRVLRPGGRLLVVTPDHSVLKRLRIALTGWEEHFDPFSPHLRFYTRGSLRHALLECGFEPPRVRRRGGALIAVTERA